MAKLGKVRPCHPERATGKFEAVYADGKAHPYVFRTEAEALAVLPDAPAEKAKAAAPAPAPAAEAKTE